MSKVLLGMVTFGNFIFTKEAIESCKKTCSTPLDFYVIVGKPNDHETIQYLIDNKIPFMTHNINKGFCASINDIYDYGFKLNNYDSIIFAGNDIIAYPYALDTLIFLSKNSDYDAISSLEVNVKDIVSNYPETRKYFSGDNFVIKDLSGRPWEYFTNYTKDIEIINPKGIIDIHNLCLYKRSVFEKAGYLDVNFFPAYFEDNDYVRRIGFTDLKTVTSNAKYFHFWSRTLHQEKGGSTNHFFELNKAYYITKWGGLPSSEKYDKPFNGIPYSLQINLDVPPDINIQRRDLESYFIDYWKNK